MPRFHFGRSTIAYWLLGLCNNYGYVVMLSAAHDMLSDHHQVDDNGKINSARKCNELSTGIILLADIIPALIVKMVAPFCSLWMNFRVILVVLSAALGFIIVGLSNSLTMTVIGVACTSFSSGLGESSLISYTVYFEDKSVLTGWSSGTGGAGFFGSMTYAALIALGLTPATTLFSLLIVPVVMAISYWIILDNPFELKSQLPSETTSIQRSSDDTPQDQDSVDVPHDISKLTFSSRIKKLPLALRYVIPLFLVYYFEYMINQGLSELSQVENAVIDPKTQYRWYQVCYQVGVFISRSSLHIVTVKNLWILVFLQALNFFFFVFQAIFLFMDNVFLMFAIIVWEGLIGGAAYINTFYKIQSNEKAEDQEVITGFTSIADSIGITFAGFSAIPIHNHICQLERMKPEILTY